MAKIRPSTQVMQDGAADGETWLWDDTTGRYVHGAPAPATHAHPESDVTDLVADLALKAPSLTLGTRLGDSSIVAGNVVLSYSTVYGIDSSGVPYYDPAGPVAGEEAVLYVGTDGGVYVVEVTA